MQPEYLAEEIGRVQRGRGAREGLPKERLFKLRPKKSIKIKENPIAYYHSRPHKTIFTDMGNTYNIK